MLERENIMLKDKESLLGIIIGFIIGIIVGILCGLYMNRLAVYIILFSIIGIWFGFLLGRLKSKGKHDNIVVVMFLITGVITFYSLLIMTFARIFVGDIKTYEDESNYELYLSDLIQNNDVHSLLYLFPSTLKNGRVTEFKYMEQDGLFDGSYYYYLVMNYDGDNYDKEYKRISSLELNYGSTKKTPIKDYIKYDTFITIYDNYNTFEYALFDKENNRIIYIFNQLFNWNEIGLENKYTLTEYNIDIKDTKQLGYNMYYLYDKYGNGISYDEYIKEK